MHLRFEKGIEVQGDAQVLTVTPDPLGVILHLWGLPGDDADDLSELQICIPTAAIPHICALLTQPPAQVEEEPV